jgi:AcrR family transcriptional regulator
LTERKNSKHNQPLFETEVLRHLETQKRRTDDSNRSRRVLASVLAEWAQVGIVEAQMSSIAQRAGISTATLYRVFPDRNALLLQAIEFGHNILFDLIRRCPDHPNPIRHLVEMVTRHAELMDEHYVQQLFISQAILLLEIDLFEETSALLVACQKRVRGYWHRVLKDLISQDLIKDTCLEVLRLLLIGTIQTKTLGWFIQGHPRSAPNQGWRREAKFIVQNFLKLSATKKFEVSASRFNWNWDLQDCGPQDDYFKVLPGQELGGIAEFEVNLAVMGMVDAHPTDVDCVEEFFAREICNLLIKKDNRLDVTHRKIRIVAATLYEVLTEGHNALSMPNVARRAGVSTATIYKLFPDDKTLYDESYALGQELYIFWLSKDNAHPNPMVRLSALLARRIETYTRPSAIKGVSSLLYSIAARSTCLPAHVARSDGQTEKLWRQHFERLKADGYLTGEVGWPMFQTYWGPVECKSYYKVVTTGEVPEPDGSWFEECWRCLDDFMAVYGTPHFHATRKRLNWDADLIAHRNADSAAMVAYG